MTVRELIEALKKQPPDLPVILVTLDRLFQVHSVEPAMTGPDQTAVALMSDEEDSA